MKKNYYDEKVYLKKDKEVYDFFEERKKEHSFDYLEEARLYKDIFKEYYKFEQKIVELLKSLNLSSTLEYSIALSYLIRKGYLSKDLNFEKKSPIPEIETNCAINIVNGKGVCRNFSDMHFGVMSRMNEYSKRFYCTNSFSMIKARKNEANHVLNLIEYENVLYGIDLCNKARLFKFSNEFILKEISFDTNKKYRYKPYFEMVSEYSAFEQIDKNLKIFKEDSKKPHISAVQYYEDILPQVLGYLYSQKDTFMDFHNETKELKNNISEEMARKLTK